MDIALQVPAFREPDIFDTLDAWTAQPVPDHITISYEAWVTPSAEPRESCSTWRQAEEHPVFEAREAPQYKLPTRNTAHSDAVRRGADVVISADADAPPLSKNTLTNLTGALKKPSVACAVANPVARLGVVGAYSNTKAYVREGVIGSIHGQCHALTADAWNNAGPFSEDIDHTNLTSVWLEEEYAFSRRVRAVGDVTYVYDAPVYEDTRRAVCKWFRNTPQAGRREFCQRARGDETFAPR